MYLPNHIFSRFASAPISVVQTITASYSTPSEAWLFKKNNSDQIPAFCGEATLYGDVLQLQVGLCMLLDELNVDFYFLLAIPQRWSLTKSETKQYHIVPFMFLPCSQVFFILFLLISQKKTFKSYEISNFSMIFPSFSHEVRCPRVSQALPVEIFEALVEGLVSSGRCRSAFETFERMKTWATRRWTWRRVQVNLLDFWRILLGFNGF